MASNLLPEKLVTTEIQARSFLVSWPCQVSEYDKKVVFQLSRSDHQLSDYIIVYSGAAKLFLVDNLIPLTTYILKLKIKFHDQDDDQWSLNFITTQTTTIDETELQKAYLEITRCLNDFQKGAVNLQAIVSKYGAQLDLNTRDKSGKTFLMVACQSSSKEVVSVLLKNGAFHDLYSKSGKSPLSIAVTFGNIRAVELLIEAGADVDVQDNGGSTPLMWACESIGSSRIGLGVYN